jgi:5-methylcytosine-specific restriction endonuclease McrA
VTLWVREDDKPCAIDGCEETIRISGMCYGHYMRVKRHGDPLAGKKTYELATDHEDGDRTCNTCKVKKPITAFYRGALYTRGRWPRCGECHVKWFTARYEENKAYYDDQFRTYRHERRAKANGGNTDPGVTREKLRGIHGDDCMYCGTPMDFTERGRRQSRTRATVEHIIPIAKGGSHTWDNTALACASCNSTKGAKTPEEFAAYLERMDAKENAWQLSA